MKTLARVICGLLLVALVSLVAVAPASAAARTHRDPRGDAPAKFDIVRVTYANTGKVIRAKVKVRGLRNLDEQALMISTASKAVRMSGAHFEIFTARIRGDFTVQGLFIHDSRGEDEIFCRGIKDSWNLRKNLVTVSVPEICFGEGYGDQRMKAAFGTFDRRSDHTKRVNVPRG